MPVTHWHGNEIVAKIHAASIDAINDTTAEAAQEAERDHWWQAHRETGLVTQTISEPARATGGGVAGRFGTTRRRGFYGLFLEYEQPFLRPVADRVFPQLAERLRQKL